jgi:hypothetical protein
MVQAPGAGTVKPFTKVVGMLQPVNSLVVPRTKNALLKVDFMFCEWFLHTPTQY